MARPLPTGSYPPSSPRKSLEAFSKLRLLILSHPFSFPCCAKLWLIKASKILALANQKSFKPYLEWIQFFPLTVLRPQIFYITEDHGSEVRGQVTCEKQKLGLNTDLTSSYHITSFTEKRGAVKIGKAFTHVSSTVQCSDWKVRLNSKSIFPIFMGYILKTKQVQIFLKSRT